MIVTLIPSASAAAIEEVATRIGEHRQLERNGAVIFVTSAAVTDATGAIAKLPAVQSVNEFKTEYQLCTRAFQPENTLIDLGNGIQFGADVTVMMAGPCAVESYDQTMRTAEFLRSKFDIRVFRAGAFKPRTSPYSFQGMEYEGLRILEQVREKFGMRIITEVKDTTHFAEVADVADIIQVGTKAMYNFALLTRCGAVSKPIVLKRGFMSTIKELLQAADVILAAGNPQVLLCERGIRSFEPQTRFCLDVCAAALLKQLSHLPLVLDPSHAMGIAAQVPLVAQTAAALGVDGLLIETHPNPAEAKSDREQALSFAQFESMMPILKRICAAVDRRMLG